MYMSRDKAKSILDKLLHSVPKDPVSQTLAAIFLFDFMEHLSANSYPTDWLNSLEKSIDSCLLSTLFLSQNLDRDLGFLKDVDVHADGSFEYKTGEVYYELWKDFDKKEYYQNTYVILSERLDKNGISLSSYNNVLDDGCGSGRYTLALKEIGCEKVTGVDISENSVSFANSMNTFGANVKFQQSSVLALPFQDETFDFVFSNGVLHHTKDTKQGLTEIYRVLQKGGACWLYLYGGKGSFFWDVVDVCRLLLKDIPQSYTMELMKILGYPPGRIFHRNDFFYVPVNNRYLESEVEGMLKSSGFADFKRLYRGVAHDWDEIIYNNPDIDPYIYGEGEMRYWITK